MQTLPLHEGDYHYQEVTPMRTPLSFASMRSGIELRVYSILSAWDVYLGLVRVALQEKFSLLAKHPTLALAAAVAVVVGVQSLIAVLSFLTLLWNVAMQGYTSLLSWAHALPIPTLFREER